MAKRKVGSLALNLPKLPVEVRYRGEYDPAKVDVAKAEFTERTSAVLAAKYRALRHEEEEAERVRKAISLRLRACEQLMEAAFEAEGLESLSLSGGDSVRVQPEPHAVVKDQAKYNDWCVAQGLAPLMSLPWQTTNGFVKVRLLENAELPPGVDVFNRPKYVLTKGK